MRCVALFVLVSGLLAGCQQGTATAPQRVHEAGEGTAAQPTFQEEGRARTQRPRRGRAEEQAAAGQFDFYLLNLSWSPEFCATHAGSPECGRGLGFVMHGLWPQDANGNFPENCSNAPGPANPGADLDIFPTRSLVEHEWKTHGTCSGLNAEAYFKQAHLAFAEVQLPKLQAGRVVPQTLLSELQAKNPSFPAGAFALSCGNNRLTAVEVCLDRNLKPEACRGVRSCGATTIGVTAP